jgi:hypothetical protein
MKTHHSVCHGEPDAVKVARPVRRAAARRPPAAKADTGASPPTLRLDGDLEALTRQSDEFEATVDAAE